MVMGRVSPAFRSETANRASHELPPRLHLGWPTTPGTPSTKAPPTLAPLIEQLSARGVKIDVATSVRRHIWDGAEIYPTPINRILRLTPEQISMIALFGDS